MTQFLNDMQVAALVRNLYVVEGFFSYHSYRRARAARFFRRRQ